MTEARFTNGCSVNRVWSDAATELLATFQYETHALSFAKLMSQDETRPDGTYYAVSNHYDGKLTIIKPAALSSGKTCEGAE